MLERWRRETPGGFEEAIYFFGAAFFLVDFLVTFFAAFGLVTFLVAFFAVFGAMVVLVGAVETVAMVPFSRPYRGSRFC